MRWLSRQLKRVQLARDLLEQYEREQAGQLPPGEAMRRVQEFARLNIVTGKMAAEDWRAAVKRRAERWP